MMNGVTKRWLQNAGWFKYRLVATLNSVLAWSNRVYLQLGDGRRRGVICGPLQVWPKHVDFLYCPSSSRSRSRVESSTFPPVFTKWFSENFSPSSVIMIIRFVPASNCTLMKEKVNHSPLSSFIISFLFLPLIPFFCPSPRFSFSI